MSPDLSVNIFVGCPQTISRLPAGPCLLLDGNAELIKSLGLQLMALDHPWPIELQQAVLSSQDQEPVVWNQFSDPRFDGPWSLEDWRESEFNLELSRQDHLDASSLECILSSSEILGDDQYSFPLTLYFRQGNPIDIMRGCGEWMVKFETILFRYPRALPLPGHEISEFFESHFYKLSDDEENAWIFDEDRFTIFQQKQLIARYEREIARYDLESKVLEMVFPYSSYRMIRSDLDGLDDRQLASHFAAKGILENVSLAHDDLLDYRQQLLKDRIAALEAHCRHLDGLVSQVGSVLASVQAAYADLSADSTLASPPSDDHA